MGTILADFRVKLRNSILATICTLLNVTAKLTTTTARAYSGPNSSPIPPRKAMEGHGTHNRHFGSF